MPRHNYLPDIWDELSKGRVEERQLQERRKQRHQAVRGWCDGQSVVVNHVPDICDTLVHELLHRRFPSWSERTVKARTTELIRRMTPNEQHHLHAEYDRLKHKKRKLTLAD